MKIQAYLHVTFLYVASQTQGYVNELTMSLRHELSNHILSFVELKTSEFVQQPICHTILSNAGTSTVRYYCTILLLINGADMCRQNSTVPSIELKYTSLYRWVGPTYGKRQRIKLRDVFATMRHIQIHIYCFTENNVRRTNTGEEGLRETKNNVFGLATEDRGRQYQLRGTKDVRSGQVQMESMKMETCHMVEHCRKRESVRVGEREGGRAYNRHTCIYVYQQVHMPSAFCRRQLNVLLSVVSPFASDVIFMVIYVIY